MDVYIAFPADFSMRVRVGNGDATGRRVSRKDPINGCLSLFDIVRCMLAGRGDAVSAPPAGLGGGGFSGPVGGGLVPRRLIRGVTAANGQIDAIRTTDLVITATGNIPRQIN